MRLHGGLYLFVIDKMVRRNCWYGSNANAAASPTLGRVKIFAFAVVLKKIVFLFYYEKAYEKRVEIPWAIPYNMVEHVGRLPACK